VASRRLDSNFSVGVHGGLPYHSGSVEPAYFTFTIGDMQPVPVPASAWLLLSGLDGLDLVARRKKQAIKPKPGIALRGHPAFSCAPSSVWTLMTYLIKGDL
jgi:hypothetical protein